MTGAAQLRIDANGPFDHDAALRVLAAHSAPELYRLDADAAELTRWVHVHGDPQPITVSLDSGGATVTTGTLDEGVNEELAARVQRWFDLDADLTPVNAHLGADEALVEHVRSRPGIRITRFHSPFEAAVLTILGQQVSLAAGRLFASRLLAAYGTSPPRGARGSVLRCFPSPAVLGTVPTHELRTTVGLTGARARTIQEVAELFARTDDTESLPEQADLQAIHGIGSWTLDHLAIRAGTSVDAFPAGDAVLRRALAAIDPTIDAVRVASWSPYRSYAASRLWAGAA